MNSAESNVAGGAAETTVAVETPKAKAKRTEPRVTMQQFVSAWESSGSVSEVADKTKLKATSVQARASKYRADGIPLKEMPRGGGAKLNVTEAQELLAKLRGVSVDVVVAEAEEAEKRRAERKAEREAEKAGETETPAA